MSRSEADVSAQQGRMQNVQPTGMTGWVGWIAFAGAMMVLLGVFHMFEGFVALYKDEYFLVGRSGLVVNVDFTTWGWTHIIGGAIIVLAGLGVFSGKIWARTVGVLLAMVSAVVNLGFLAAYPLWSTIMIAMDFLVIWALTAHGSEVRG